jgi:hypothetical protein
MNGIKDELISKIHTGKIQDIDNLSKEIKSIELI